MLCTATVLLFLIGTEVQGASEERTGGQQMVYVAAGVWYVFGQRFGEKKSTDSGAVFVCSFHAIAASISLEMALYRSACSKKYQPNANGAPCWWARPDYGSA
jgi:hypothetical protein